MNGLDRLGWSLMMLTFVAAVPARAELIDRVLAVVGDHIITLSDARAARRLELVPSDDGQDPLAGLLQRLIERRLILVEVERYAPAEPSEEAIDAAVAAIESRFPDPAAFDAALRATAMSRADVREYARNSLRIDAYLQQRFASTVDPPEEDLMAYYRTHQDAFTGSGVLRSFESVRAEVAARIAEERRAAVVRDWLDGLRRRTSVIVLYLPAAAAR